MSVLSSPYGTPCMIVSNFSTTKLTFICSKSTIETNLLCQRLSRGPYEEHKYFNFYLKNFFIFLTGALMKVKFYVKFSETSDVFWLLVFHIVINLLLDYSFRNLGYLQICGSPLVDYRIFSKERLCSKERLPFDVKYLMSASLFSPKWCSSEK